MESGWEFGNGKRLGIDERVGRVVGSGFKAAGFSGSLGSVGVLIPTGPLLRGFLVRCGWSPGWKMPAFGKGKEGPKRRHALANDSGVWFYASGNWMELIDGITSSSIGILSVLFLMYYSLRS